MVGAESRRKVSRLSRRQLRIARGREHGTVTVAPERVHGSLGPWTCRKKMRW